MSCTPSLTQLDRPQWYKHYIAVVICVAMMMCNFLAAGPTIAIISTTMSFFPNANPMQDPQGFSSAIGKVSYFFTSTALLQGLGNFFWVPVANKFGRRPTYVASYAIYTACAIWLCFEKDFNGFLAGRIIMGFGAGAAETIGMERDNTLS
jgi:MFS family permease